MLYKTASTIMTSSNGDSCFPSISPFIVEAEFAAGRAKDPAWFRRFEASLELTDVEELIELMTTAPTDFLRGSIYGRILVLEAEASAARHPH